MFDDSGISLSASDPNPSIEQSDDFGAGYDFSSIIGSAGQWGTEIASVITGRPVAYAPGRGGPVPIGAPGSYVGNSPPMTPITKLLIVILIVGGGTVLIRSMN